MKKIISLLSALAIFSSMAVTGFAEFKFEPSAQATVNSNPIVEGYVDVAQSEGANCIINFKLSNCEELSYYEDLGYYTSNGISSFTVKVTLDTEVFDVSGSRISTSYEGAATSGAKTANFTWTFNPTSVAGYSYTNPDVLFMIRVPYNTGYDVKNIPDEAISFGECILCYSKYEDSDKRTNYTRYGINGVVGTNGQQVVDYPLTVKFEGTAEEGGDEPTITPVDMVAGVDSIANGPHAGKATISTPVAEAVDFEGLEKITVECTAEAERVEEWVAPATLGDGKSNVIAVVAFDKAALAGETFTVKFLGALDAVLKVFTYEVQ